MRLGRPVAGWFRNCAIPLGLVLVPAGALDDPALHFSLSGSEPAAEATVSPPEELRLWFTQAPQDHSMSVRLMAGDAPVETGPPIAAAEDDRVYSVAVGRTLEEGGYNIVWRAMAADGHVVRGEIPFKVRVP